MTCINSAEWGKWQTSAVVM